MTLPAKISNGMLLLPVWKPLRVFNLSALEVNIEDPEIKDNPKQGRTYLSPLVVQLWMSPKTDEDYVAIGEVVLPPGKYRAFNLITYINDFGFEEVVRIPETAQVVAVTNAYPLDVSSPVGSPPPPPGGAETKPQVDLKIHGTFL